MFSIGLNFVKKKILEKSMSENFKNIIRELPPVFNTEEGHHIGKEFNSPCIIGSSLYQRQTGALTSNFLKVLTRVQLSLISALTKA